jgi:hypothetical protein
MTVFVSYSSRDRDAVKSLTQDLHDADEQVWMDQRLAGGEAWWRAILEQIRGCDVFIFALSQNSIESKPCRAELQYAKALGLPVLPVQVGPVDSMSLNPLATVQAIDYRHQTPNTGMRLIAALNRERARRQPLPEPLPDEPPVPFEYLIRLYTTISNPDYLTPRDQAALVAHLQVGLGEDGQHEAARNDIVMLLTKLHDREDATHRTRTDVEAILASIGAESPPQRPIGTETLTPVEEQLGVTTPPVSTADTGHEPADNDRTTPIRATGTDPRTELDDHRIIAPAPADELTSGHASAKSLETPSVSPSRTSVQRPGEQPTQLAEAPPYPRPAPPTTGPGITPTREKAPFLKRISRRTKILITCCLAAVAVAATVLVFLHPWYDQPQEEIPVVISQMEHAWNSADYNAYASHICGPSQPNQSDFDTARTGRGARIFNVTRVSLDNPSYARVVLLSSPTTTSRTYTVDGIVTKDGNHWKWCSTTLPGLSPDT